LRQRRGSRSAAGRARYAAGARGVTRTPLYTSAASRPRTTRRLTHRTDARAAHWHQRERRALPRRPPLHSRSLLRLSYASGQGRNRTADTRIFSQDQTLGPSCVQCISVLLRNGLARSAYVSGLRACDAGLRSSGTGGAPRVPGGGTLRPDLRTFSLLLYQLSYLAQHSAHELQRVQYGTLRPSERREATLV